MVASSSFESREAEVRTISAVTTETVTIDGVLTSVTKLEVDSIFNYGHESHLEVLSDGEKIPMRAEVGLLTRNVVF